MEQYQGSVIRVVNNGISHSIPFVTRKEAEKIFLQMCKDCSTDRGWIFGFDKYTAKEIEVILKIGWERLENGFIAIGWFTNHKRGKYG